ncbi:hypothetical protein [Denitromonas iodatirespirans]|uniref:Uncharacterized protein n=1 Tax=Denitromonas iodatirespirans TaxID=2795389 RepID=A0A944DJQ9_DENI1|nr:hypothetical protein [Denitromonas iodatirespirans]MBT0964203.1 hypothetical protein [Denitromonas iodatirespirans]
MAAIDLDQLVSDMKVAASGILNADVSTFRGFSERQLKAIAQQATLVATGIATKQITEETEQFFLDSLEDMALSFAKTLRGLLMVTIEKIWSAVVGVLWNAISKAANVVLPVPVLN